MSNLTHIDSDGRARMVDVGDKGITRRTAVAEGFVHMSPETLKAALAGATKKGAVIPVAEVAGIMGAKRTADLVPMCHPLALNSVKVQIEEADAPIIGLKVVAEARIDGKTGVEMEALTSVMVACLTLYDMLKAIDKKMSVEGVRLLSKTGGASWDVVA